AVLLAAPVQADGVALDQGLPRPVEEDARVLVAGDVVGRAVPASDGDRAGVQEQDADVAVGHGGAAGVIEADVVVGDGHVAGVAQDDAGAQVAADDVGPAGLDRAAGGAEGDAGGLDENAGVAVAPGGVAAHVGADAVPVDDGAGGVGA